MALEIFRLIGSIFVDSDAANKSIQKTDDKASKVGETLLKGVGTAAKWSAGLLAGAGAVAGGITAAANATAASCDEIDKMSQKIGISREAYQELDFILSQNGMDVNKLQTGMKTLVSSMQSAKDGSAKATAAFDALGVSAVDADGNLRSQEDVFYDTIAALQGMSNEAERSALANQLFGKSATEMAPLLNSGAGSMEALRQKAHDLGIVLSDDVVDAGVGLTDTMDQLKRSFQAVGANLGGVLMPVVQNVANFIIDNMPMIQGAVQQLAPVITVLFQELVPPLLNLASSLLPMLITLFNAILPIASQLITAIIPVIIQLLETLLPPIIQIVETLLPPLLALLQPILDLLGPLIELLQPILDLVVAILQPLAQLITDLLTPLISVISKVINAALVPLREQFGLLSSVLSGTFNEAVSLVLNLVNTIEGVFSGLIQFIKGVFTGDWKSAWEGVQKIFSSIWEGIKTAFKAQINWIIDGINSFIRGVNRIKVPDWVPAVGGKGFSIKEIPRLAAGGVLEKGQTGFLEGNGAEAVVPLENNKRWISKVANDMQSELNARDGGASGAAVVQLLKELIEVVGKIAKAGVTLDGDKLVGAIAPGIDRELYRLQDERSRGLA